MKNSVAKTLIALLFGLPFIVGALSNTRLDWPTNTISGMAAQAAPEALKQPLNWASYSAAQAANQSAQQANMRANSGV